jgi:hypothetical protein
VTIATRRRRPSAGAVVLSLVLAGCGAAEPPPAAVRRVPEASAEARALHVPFDDYTLSTLDIQTVEYAEDLLIRDCMRGRGLRWEMLPPPASEDPNPLNRRRYGLIEPELAARYGYHLPPQVPELAARDAVWDRRDRLPRAERSAAYGDDGQGGCTAQARRHLREDIPNFNDQYRLNDFATEDFAASQQDPEVLRVYDSWRACMATAGFDYANPFAAFDDPAWGESSRPSEREIAVAEADVRCKQETRLVETWAAAEERIQLDTIRTHPQDFASFRHTKDTHLAAARQAIRELG